MVSLSSKNTEESFIVSDTTSKPLWLLLIPITAKMIIKTNITIKTTVITTDLFIR